MLIKVIAGMAVFIVLALVYSFIESEAEKDYEERKKYDGPQVLDEDDFE